MTEPRFDAVIRLIDDANRQDPNREVWQDMQYSKEYLYSLRMTECLDRCCQNPSEELRIAARGQHIRRWEVPRNRYPADREGYLRWRIYLYDYHATKVGELMDRAGYGPDTIDRVKTLIRKRGIKTDADVQIIEDAACLVFLSYYLTDFSRSQDPAKLIDIIRKTWRKMSESGQQAALTIDYPDPVKEILSIALHGA